VPYKHDKMMVPQFHQGGLTLNSQKCLLLLMLVFLLGASAEAQKKAAKASAPAAQKKEITDKDVPRMSVDQLILAMAGKKPIVIIDVRHKDDYSHKIKGALQIPLDEIEARMKEIPRNKEIITYCT
jgi:hypothetical protein